MDRLWTPWRMPYLTADKPSGCIFCQALAEGLDSSNLVVHRAERAFVMLNRYPYNNGHAMVVPNRHVGSLELLQEAELLSIMQLVNLTLAGLRNLASPDGFNIGVNLGKAAGAGIEAHVHVHVVPRWQGDTNFMPILAHTRVIPESLTDTRSRLQGAIERVLAGQTGGECGRDG
ncbi:MAG: HIT domain-containing protein [Anaerolineae bacterium]|nr:HIT domain-containing protein [Anaerolineae bacterium]